MKYQQIIAQCEPSQTHAELSDLLVELEKVEIKRVLEIGVHRGGSILVWQKVLKPDLLMGIDTQITEEFKVIPDVYKIEGNSQDMEVFSWVICLLGGDLLDFLFIDGSHYYNDVKADFELYRPLVRKGGVIALHDVILQGNDTCEVYRFWEELKQKYNTKTISYLDTFGAAATGCGVVYL